MIPVAKLIELFQKMYREHWPYVSGAAKEGCVDCSGAFDYAFETLHGIDYPHGSNAIARKYIVGKMLPITDAKPGMAAFKVKLPGEDGYDLPDKYKTGSDLSDYYHIGLVDDDPKYVLNAKGTKQGFCRDALTRKNGWDCVAYLKGVDYGGGDEVSYQARVVGGGLNMRKTASTTAERLVQIPDGTLVHVTEESGEWAKTSYSGHTGWVLAKYLEPTGEDSDTVVVSRKMLESIYDQLGDVLGLRG